MLSLLMSNLWNLTHLNTWNLTKFFILFLLDFSMWNNINVSYWKKKEKEKKSGLYRSTWIIISKNTFDNDV